MPELLLELFSEEIPARMQGQAAEDLKRLMTERLKAAGLTFDRAEAFATPRRLTLVVDGLPLAQPDVREERKGPRADAPDKAIEGFLRSTGLRREDLEERATDKGGVLFAVIEKKGQPVADVIAAMVPEIIRSFPWPKSQRWGAGTLRWVRPLQSILCVFDGAVVPFEVNGIAAGAKTRGHRFLAPDPFTVTDFADYRAKLQAARVMLDPAARRDIIAGEAARIAAEAGLEVIEDRGLLAEVAGLVEWPVALMGSFDPDFLEVPAEVLTATMRTNQKYFSLRDPKTGKLAPHFIVIANMEARDGGAQIIAGNERVLRARLADARFFWDQDLQVRLEDRLPELDGIVFHAKLGSMGDKVRRMEALARHIAPLVGADPEDAARAAKLAKADLVSGVVGEFPEVQGIMGRYYALAQGEKAEVAQAIAEHYSPKGPDDACPAAPVSVAVALADKIDTLVGFFGVNEKPTGSKDPFALRRAALGILRMVNENGLRLPLHPVFNFAGTAYGATDAALVAELTDFIADRLKVYLRDHGLRHDLVSAVFALGEDDMLRLKNRVEALQKMVETEDGANLLAAYARGSNIVRIEEQKDKRAYDGLVDPSLLVQPEEKTLHARLQAVQDEVTAALGREDWIAAMTAVASLRTAIDAFFDEVTVNDADPRLRENRLNLLAAFRATLKSVADFSRIEG